MGRRGTAALEFTGEQARHPSFHRPIPGPLRWRLYLASFPERLVCHGCCLRWFVYPATSVTPATPVVLPAHAPPLAGRGAGGCAACVGGRPCPGSDCQQRHRRAAAPGRGGGGVSACAGSGHVRSARLQAGRLQHPAQPECRGARAGAAHGGLVCRAGAAARCGAQQPLVPLHGHGHAGVWHGPGVERTGLARGQPRNHHRQPLAAAAHRPGRGHAAARPVSGVGDAHVCAGRSGRGQHRLGRGPGAACRCVWPACGAGAVGGGVDKSAGLG